MWQANQRLAERCGRKLVIVPLDEFLALPAPDVIALKLNVFQHASHAAAMISMTGA
jgi:hypothetical protein